MKLQSLKFSGRRRKRASSKVKPKSPIRLSPEERFPVEVRKLHSHNGIPFPSWYSGPLYPEDGFNAAWKKYQQHCAAEKNAADDGDS